MANADVSGFQDLSYDREEELPYGEVLTALELQSIIEAFHTFYDYGDETRTDAEEAIIAELDTELERDSFASFLSGYKFAHRIIPHKK